ncbi:MAG: O-antigen ligase family protein [Patescibacteria group bacterium]|nr:O-antigen ligase family protein [Patescibacteria group bacterium]
MNIQKITRGIVISALFLVPIFALIVANSFFFPFITGKAFYFRILVEIAFAGWLVLAFLDTRYRPRWTPLSITVTVFAIVALVADLLGVNPIRSLWSNFERMEGWITIVHLWAFFMVTTEVFGADGPEAARRMWHRWFNFELFVALIVGLYGLGQYFGWFAIHQSSSRVDASLGNSAYMAVYMLMNAGLAMYLFFVAKARKIANAGFLVWAYPILAVLFSFLLFETATRGTILGLIGAIMTSLAVYAVFGSFAKNGPKPSARSRWIAGGIVIVVMAVVLAFIPLRHASFVQNNDVLSRMASISLSNSETTARLYIWNMALTGAKERPVLGWGQENFNYIFNQNYDAHMWGQEQWFDRAHSVYLDWLVNGGIVGLLAYLSLYVVLLIVIWKSDLGIGEKSVLTGLLAGYAVHNIFVFDNLASYILFFSVLAFANSLKANPENCFATKLFRRWTGKEAMSIEAVEYIAAPIVVVALIVSVYFYNVRPIEANTRLIAALEDCSGSQGVMPDVSSFESALAVNTYVANQEIREQILSCAAQVISSQSIPGPTKQAFFQLAGNAIQDQIAATPWKDARIYTLGGSFMDQIGQFDQGARLLTIAHELSPAKQSIDLELTNALINTGQVDKAVTMLASAYQADTSDDQVKQGYALVLVVSGQEAKAHELFGNDPSVFSTPQMAQAYMMVKEYSNAVAIYQAAYAANPNDVNSAAQLAQAQFQAGDKSAAVATLQSIEKAHPEYKSQIDAAIKQVQGGK